MFLKWMKQDQFTDYGYFRVDDVIDEKALEIPEDIIGSWMKDGWVEEIPAPPVRERKSKVKEANNG